MDGKELARDIKAKIKTEIDNIKKIHNINPMVATILVGDNQASQVYLNSQIKSYQDLEIGVQKYFFSEEISEAYLLNLIDKLNKDTEVDGIMVNLPLPPQINVTKVLNSIKLVKDVDGFKAENLGLLFQNNEGFTSPSTPAGIMALIEKYNIDLEGKDVVVVGSSNIVGKPIAALILNSRGTVTICNIYTKNLAEKTKNADILISAVGKPKLITEDMVKEGAVVIDVGINRVNGKLEGDVDFESVQKKASHITPVPGGVGALTVAMLLSNILKSFKANRGII